MPFSPTINSPGLHNQIHIGALPKSGLGLAPWATRPGTSSIPTRYPTNRTKATGSSSFWFQVEDTPGWLTEFDVFEIGGKAKGFERKYNMNVHVFRTPTKKEHWSVGGVWIAPWRLADDYHVYGLEWRWFHADDRDVWNDVEIVCRDTRIKTIMNGVTIADHDGAGRLDDEAHRSHNVGMKGHIGLQIHPGKELLIRFKDIEVRKL